MTTAKRTVSVADPSDEALLGAIARDADRSAFALLFERFAGRIKAFLIKSGAPGDQAEEVAQDVMVTIWRKAASFDPAKASAATWIFTIARNRRIDVIRRMRRPQPDPEDPSLSPPPQLDAAAEISVAERNARVRRALSSLTEDQRAVVHLAFFAGLSHGEISERVGTPLGTVKSRLRLAFGRLRSELGAQFSDELNDH